MKATPLKIYKASAGSGKTFTLAVEYISLLAKDPTAYRNILAVTFTNKATAEMKQRILGTLYGIANGLEGAEKYIASLPLPRPEGGGGRKEAVALLRLRCKEALSNIIHDYSRFRIETIDSFFQSIVREIASELELPVNMKVELDEGEVLSDAVDDIIDNLREDSSEFRSIIEFIEEKIRGGRSWQVDETVKEFGRNIFKENYLMHGDDVRGRITDRGAIHRYRQVLKDYLEEQRKRVTTAGERLMAAYGQAGMTEKDGTKGIVTFLGKVCEGNIKDPQGSTEGTFSSSIAEHMENPGKWFKSASKNRSTLEPQVVDVLMPMLRELFDAYHTYLCHAHTVSAIFQHIYSLMLISEISQKVKSLNEEKNRFLLSETAKFLQGMIQHQDIPFIYEKTGSVIKHIMIDEFQDTSALQWSNFKPLIQNSMAMGGTCLIVGDVKQSIYRFRNSDWQILNNIERDRDLRGNIETIPAEYNYRSARHVVEFNNQFFAKATEVLKEDCPDLATAYGDVEQKPRKEKQTGFVRVESLAPPPSTDDPAETPQTGTAEDRQQGEEAMLQRLQLSVKELIEGGVKANDITILIRTNREVAQISDYFNEHQDTLDVKIVSDDAFRLDASPAVNLTIDALRVLATQDDALHLATLEHHYRQPLPPGFDQQARQRLRFKALPELVEDIYQIFQLARLPQQDAYLFFFNDMVEKFGEDNLADINTFLQAWDEHLCGKTIPNGAADGVRIMTMHKSKGLEFHTVIIPSCSWTIKPKDTEVMWCLPQEDPYKRMPLLPISVRKATDDSIFADDRRKEELRTLVDNINVLYVAFTRAKNNLIILTDSKTGEAFDQSAPVETAQQLLLKAMPDCMQKAEEEEEEEDESVVTFQYGSIVPTEETAGEKEQNVMECDYSPLPVTFVSHPSAAEFRQSYESDLFITEESPSPKVQQHAERIRLISLGNLYHSIFQHIHTIDDIPHAVQMLESKGCFGTLLDAKEARATVERLVGSVADTHPEWFSPDWTVLNERAILFLDGGELSTKRPDRVVVNGQTAIVIDYKTAQGAVRQKADGTLSAPSENVQQISGYRDRLLQLGYTDVKAYLWYILDEIIVPV